MEGEICAYFFHFHGSLNVAAKRRLWSGAGMGKGDECCLLAASLRGVSHLAARQVKRVLGADGARLASVSLMQTRSALAHPGKE